MAELFPWEPPSWVPINAWNAYVDNRLHIQKVKKTARWTDLARDRAIKHLDDLRKEGLDIEEVLLTAAEHGWQDVLNAADHVRKHAARGLLHSRRTAEPAGPTSKLGAAIVELHRMRRGG